jgi:hypothetical protein
MKVPLEDEVCQILAALGIHLLGPGHPIVDEFHRACVAFRSHLVNLETSQDRPPLSRSSFWEITPKYRFDVLSQDIPNIANQLAFAIGFSSLYLGQVAESTTTYFKTFADAFFWYHIDFGIRLASSGWDRIALLLDLAFDLNTGTRCSLPLVLKEIPNIDAQIIQDKNFKKLKAFRDGGFLDLEARAGEGARHEATHLLSPSTRFLCEFLDAIVKKPGKAPPESRPKERRDMLVEHHGLYVSGIENAAQLVSSRWS